MKLRAIIVYGAVVLAIAGLLAFVIILATGKENIIEESPVYATVNGEEIRADEVSLYINLSRLNRGMSSVPTHEELLENRRLALDTLVERKLVMQETAKRDIGVDETEVENALDTDFGEGGRAKLIAALEEQNIPFEVFKGEIRYELLFDKLDRSIEEDLRDRVTVSDEEVRDYFEESKERRFTTMKLAHIYVKIPGPGNAEDREQAETKAKEVIRRLDESAEFGALAAEYSDDVRTKNKGGYLGEVSWNDLGSAIAQEAFKLKPGEHTPFPVEAYSGFHIINCIDRSFVPLDDVKEELRQEMFAEKLLQLKRGFYERLKARAEIKINVQ